MKLVPRFLATLLLCTAPALALERPGADPVSPALPQGPSITIEGMVQALYADDFDGGRSELLYHLVKEDGTRLPLAFSDPVPSYRTGDRLRVSGRMDDAGRFEVEKAEPARGPLAESAEPVSALTTGAKRMLLIRYNFSNDTSQPYSDATSQAVMFGAAGSTAAFYAEGSYGLTTQTGSITPWLTVAAVKPTTCDISSYTQASALASAAGYNPGTFDYVVYVFPHIPCGWAGLGVVGGSGAWINQALSTYVVAHEVGHNYGLWHSHSWDCGATPLGPSCTRSEYGDPFDTMGGNLRQFNAYSKASELGWLSGGSVATRSSGVATYTLMPLESGSGLRALQLPTSVAGRTYWVEFRQAIGFDSGLSGNANVMNGALIHLGPSAVGGSDLLDMTPATNTFGDAALEVGNSYSDAAAGLTITTVSKSGSTLNVRVDFTGVVPTASFTFSPASPLSGQTVTFQDTSTGATSWNWDFGDTGTSTQQSPTHVYVLAGTYTVALRASNSHGTSVASTRTVTVASAPATETLAVFASDCSTPRTNFRLGDSVCIRVSNVASALLPPTAPSGAIHFQWIAPGSVVVQNAPVILTSPQTSLFVLPMTGANARAGAWQVRTSNNSDNSARTPLVTFAVASGDFNLDGRSDIVWRNYTTGQNALWLMNGTSLAGVQDLPALPNTNYHMGGMGDFNGDGKLDIVWRNIATGQNAVWLMNATSLQSIVNLPALPNLDYQIGAIADLNHDGKPDIVWRNSVTGRNAVWLMNGSSLQSVVDLPALPNLAYHIVGAADMNADGETDILWRNDATGQNAVWLMNGTSLGTIVNLPTLANVNYRVGAVADYSGDGKVDIVWRNYATGQNAVWVMNGVSFSSVVDLPALPNLNYAMEGKR